jgi:hypothetical protein
MDSERSDSGVLRVGGQPIRTAEEKHAIEHYTVTIGDSSLDVAHQVARMAWIQAIEAIDNWGGWEPGDTIHVVAKRVPK